MYETMTQRTSQTKLQAFMVITSAYVIVFISVLVMTSNPLTAISVSLMAGFVASYVVILGTNYYNISGAVRGSAIGLYVNFAITWYLVIATYIHIFGLDAIIKFFLVLAIIGVPICFYIVWRSLD